MQDVQYIKDMRLGTGLNTVRKCIMPRDNLIQARRKKKLTQAALADRIGCERKAIVRWELGTVTPSFHYQEKLATELGRVDDEHLFDLFPDASVTKTEKRSLSRAQPCRTLESSGTLDSLTELSNIQHSEEGTDMDPRRRKINTTIAIAAST